MPGTVGRQSAATTADAILDMIRSSGQVSRTELAARSGLTGASITRIVRQLLDDKLVIEVGTATATSRGKPRTLLQVKGRARCAIGISLDYLRTNYVLVDLDGTLIGQATTKGTGSRQPTEVIAQVAADAAKLLADSGMDEASLRGIGVAVAGHLTPRETVHQPKPRARYWQNYDLEAGLRSMTTRPVVAENDSTCAALGEHWLGRLPTSTNFATVYMTSGFGLGLMVNGEAYRGASALAGEISHIVVDPRGPECPCGRHGCLHSVATVERIVELATNDKKLSARLGLKGTSRSQRADFDRVAAAAVQGDDAAAKLIQISADALASVMVSVTNLLDLEQVTLAGPGFVAAGELYAETMRREFAAFALSRARHTIDVRLSTHGDDVAALGAASLVLSAIS